MMCVLSGSMTFLYRRRFSALKALTLILLFSQAHAYAGNLVGNGGLLVKCDNFIDRSHQLLDFFEANDSQTVDGDLLSQGANEYEITRAVINRLSRIDRVRASRYLYWATTFSREVDFLETPLQRTMDAGLVPELPQDCEIVQGAVQKKSVVEGESRYLINLPAWETSPIMDRAGLIIHELVVRDALAQGFDTTEGVRRYVRFLFSRDLLVVNNEGYQSQLRAAWLSSSIFSSKMHACRESLASSFVNRNFLTQSSTNSRNYGAESATTNRYVSTDFLSIRGNEIIVPMQVSTRSLIYASPRASDDTPRLLRSGESSRRMRLRIYEYQSSPYIFGALESVDPELDGSRRTTISGIVECSESSVRFKGQDLEFVEYKVAGNEFVLTKSSYDLEWRRDSLEEKSSIETHRIDPVTLQKVDVIGDGWPD